MTAVLHFIKHAISFLGYPGIALLMAIQSACIPLPSEITMPFSGYLASTGRFSFAGVVLSGATGDLLGAVFIYLLAARIGIPKFIPAKHAKQAQDFFEHHGAQAVFIGRIVSGIRSVIAVPAGLTRVPFLSFCLWTFLGSLIWCGGLAYLGFFLGQRWVLLQPYFHRFSLAVLVILAGGIGYYLWKSKLAVKR